MALRCVKKNLTDSAILAFNRKHLLIKHLFSLFITEIFLKLNNWYIKQNQDLIEIFPLVGLFSIIQEPILRT